MTPNVQKPEAARDTSAGGSVAPGTALHVTRAVVEPWAVATTSVPLAVTKVAVIPVRSRWRSGVPVAPPSWLSPVGVNGAPNRLAVKRSAGVLHPAITRPVRPTGATPAPAPPADSPACCRCPAAPTPARSPAMTRCWSSPNRCSWPVHGSSPLSRRSSRKLFPVHHVKYRYQRPVSENMR